MQLQNAHVSTCNRGHLQPWAAAKCSMEGEGRRGEEGDRKRVKVGGGEAGDE